MAFCGFSKQNVNPYNNERRAAFEKFTEKYDFFGEKLRIPEEIESDKKEHVRTMHTTSELSKYADISEKHYNAAMKIDEYRSECEDKALSLFKEYFRNLWD